MRLPKLEDVVIKANARYFFHQGYISSNTYDRVFRWLDGEEDGEIQRIVIGWMKRDAAWLDEVTPAVVERFRYAAPVIRTAVGHIREMILSRVRELEGG